MNKIINDKIESISDYKLDSLRQLVSMFTSYLKLFRSDAPHIKLYPNSSTQGGLTEQCDESKCNRIIEVISAKFNIHPPLYTNMKPKNINCIDASINRALKFNDTEWSYLSQYEEDELELDFERIVSDSVDEGWNQVDLTTQSGVIFTVYYKGEPVNDTIVFVPPCGMPAEAFSSALQKLQEQYFVMTWENPFLFHGVTPNKEWTMADDIQCIEEMMQYFKCSRIHLIGVCGGVPIAIAAAAKLKTQIITLSSCHGDIYLGKGSPMTPFKKQFLDFTQTSLENESAAREIHELLLDPALLLSMSDTLAPYIVYPYLSFEIYMKYADINSALMLLDLSIYLDELDCYLLVISSEDDRIAHPDVSRLLYEKVKGSELWMRAHGEHHDVISGDADVYKKIISSIEYCKTIGINSVHN